MANRLAFTILVTVLGTSTLLAACSDEEDRIDGMNGGEAGSEAGTETGGSSSGGTSAGKGGSLMVGGEMQGGQSPGQAGAAGDAGMTGEGGDAMVGGAGGGTDGGASGMGGAGGADNPPVEYACGSTTLAHRICSAFTAAACDSLPECIGGEPEGSCCTDCVTRSCPDCVPQTNDEREPFAPCPACLAEYDRSLQCAIDAFEAGNLSDGVTCYDAYGADRSGDCYLFFDSAVQCQGYAATPAGCPANWPL